MKAAGLCEEGASPSVRCTAFNGARRHDQTLSATLAQRLSLPGLLGCWEMQKDAHGQTGGMHHLHGLTRTPDFGLAACHTALAHQAGAQAAKDVAQRRVGRLFPEVQGAPCRSTPKQ